MISYEDIVMKNLREYMTFKNEAVEKQVFIITMINNIYSKHVEHIEEILKDILADNKITFSDIPDLIRLISKSIDVICLIDNSRYSTADVLRYFIFYTINKYANGEIKYMPNDDLIAYYDSIYELLIMKIAKINCLSCKK